jgi:LPS sulfotransferase NodH
MSLVLENRKSYAVCANPRSGSTYFTILLKSTNVLGKPYEWLRADGGKAHQDYINYPTDPQEQLELLLRDGCTPNGILALKMFPEHFDRRIESYWAKKLPSLQYVYLIRQDLLGQAISLSIARQTDSYAHWAPERREPIYNSNHIRNCMDFIATGDARWRLFFASNGIKPLFITYEDLTKAPQEIVNHVAALMGVESAPIDWSEFNTTVQRNERNAQWRARFIQEEGDLAILPGLVGVPFEDALWPPPH